MLKSEYIERRTCSVFLVCFETCSFFFFQYQGDEKLDTDIPTEFEGKLFRTSVTKTFWVILQPFFYACRPFFVYPKPPTLLEFVNLVAQVAFDVGIYYLCGTFCLAPTYLCLSWVLSCSCIYSWLHTFTLSFVWYLLSIEMFTRTCRHLKRGSGKMNMKGVQ